MVFLVPAPCTGTVPDFVLQGSEHLHIGLTIGSARLGSLVSHLHDFIQEVNLTESEWLTGVQFLTAVGQKCDDKRQEFILLSDTLGGTTTW